MMRMDGHLTKGRRATFHGAQSMAVADRLLRRRSMMPIDRHFIDGWPRSD